MSKSHYSAYDEVTTARCERALVTLLGDIGPWSERIYLAGGLAPRYIVGSLPEGARPHVGTTDVDLVIGLALGDESPEAYRTLENNLKKAGFKAESSFRWIKDVQGVNVIVEFLCETDQVEPGRIYKPKEEGTGSGLGAFNVRGAQLVTRDYLVRTIEAETRRWWPVPSGRPSGKHPLVHGPEDPGVSGPAREQGCVRLHLLPAELWRRPA